MAATTNLYVDQGADFSANIDILQDDGTPLSLSGANVVGMMRRSYYSTTSYSFVSSITDSANGIIKLHLPADISSNIKAGRYLYDVRVRTYNSNIRVLEGILIIYPQITQ